MKTGLRHLIVPKTLRLLFKDLDTPDGFSPFQQKKKSSDASGIYWATLDMKQALFDL